MEICVNDYVRTNNGIIRKVNNLFLNVVIADKPYIEFYKEEVIESIAIGRNEIVKHSPNIIDLIEVGDYVNEHRVVDIMEDMKTGELHLEMTSDYTNQEIGDCTIYNKDIKSIVTNQQFSNIEYKVGE